MITTSPSICRAGADNAKPSVAAEIAESVQSPDSILSLARDTLYIKAPERESTAGIDAGTDNIGMGGVGTEGFEEGAKIGNSEIDGSEIDGSEIDGSEIDGSETDGFVRGNPEIDMSGIDGSEIDGSSTDNSEIERFVIENIETGNSEIGRSDTQSHEIRSSETESFGIESSATDTLRREAFHEPDTVTVKGGVLTLNSERILEEMYRQMQDSAKVKRVRTVSPESETAKERSRIFKDSLSFATVSAVSFVIPGFGQLYNRQAWKIPILYGTVGGFAAGAGMLGKQAGKYDRLYKAAMHDGLPTEQIDALHRKANRYKTERTLCIAGAAASYLYFIGDAALNYKGAVHDTRKATVLSAIFPGAGQIYNKSYWKLPIVWGGMAAFGYIIDYNNRGYQRFKRAYNALTDGDPETVDEFQGRYEASFLQNTRDSYRRYRDLGIIMIGGFYLLNIIDAHVEAYLRRYDISDNLSMSVEPVVMDAPVTTARSGSRGMGMSMRLNF